MAVEGCLAMTPMIAAFLLAVPSLLQHPLPPDGKFIPPIGMSIPDPVRTALLADAEALGKRISALKTKSDLWPDIEIHRKAVEWALRDKTVYSAGELAAAKELLEEGNRRADALEKGEAPWNAQTGLVVRGYVSKLDGSVQPYGLVVPANWDPKGTANHRLDLFFHGRGETLTELSFLAQRRRSGGEFLPAGAFVLHPYGRFCNANHLAGEVDVFEALDDVRRRYRIDDERTVIRGFSMGGASTWHLAVHHPDRWAAAAPGAGFSETPDFVKAYVDGRTFPDWQVQLWKLYDATDWASNLLNLPTVAYDGEKDGQKQAADMMEKALRAEGMALTRITGPGTGHSYHPASKVEIDAYVDKAVAPGRSKAPRELKFTLWTLRYNRHYWVVVDRLIEHWKRGRVDAERDAGDSVLTVSTSNIAAFSLATPRIPRSVVIDGQRLAPSTRYVRDAAGTWGPASRAKTGLAKVHGLQGPIDDAFMERFAYVRPTGKGLTPAGDAWARTAMDKAVFEWRRTFRGEAQVVDDTAVDGALVRDANLVLWGDPRSNAVWRRIADKLPLRWTDAGLVVNGKTYPAGEAAPVLVFPNPLNPKRYVVLNSGLTFHEHQAGNNALHTPKLPDWAVLKMADGPMQVLDAGFFDESWGWKPRP